MKCIDVKNPFRAPVYYEETVGSTMENSRLLARQGEMHGTIITAGFQEAGRGRIRGRSWCMERGANLMCTVLLRYPGIEVIPAALTLRTGLAVALAIEEYAPCLMGRIKIKWPNDILISDTISAGKAESFKKVAGILVEADGGTIHIGIGVNVAQKQFPDFLQDKAVSIGLASGRELSGEERFVLLEKILVLLHTGLKTDDFNDNNWKNRIEERLYKKGELVQFIQGAADSGKIINGILGGIGPGGELLITPEGEKQAISLITGELSR